MYIFPFPPSAAKSEGEIKKMHVVPVLLFSCSTPILPFSLALQHCWVMQFLLTIVWWISLVSYEPTEQTDREAQAHLAIVFLALTEKYFAVLFL